MKEQEILRNISDRLGIKALNEIQATMADVNDPLVVLTAPTGSGKTLAFAISALKAMGVPDGHIQTVVIAPSRELVLQIYDVIRPIAVGYKVVAFYGGHSMQDEVNSLLMVPDIVISTPGRLVDHINRFQLKPGTQLKTLVLDEYDKALELGFADEMKRIMRFFVAPEHIILTSATPLLELPDYFPVAAPRHIDFISSAASDDPRRRMHIEHVESPSRDKLDILADVVADTFTPGGRTIVFVNHRESAERVWSALRKLRFPVGLYHGGLEQRDREKAVELLNNGTTPILVSTDLASRGLDIEAVDTVIHYHLPPSLQSWTHRNGRTARVDRQGRVIVITSDADSLPEYVEWDNDYYPRSNDELSVPSTDTATLYFNLGKKEKLSRGDIVGFLIAVGGLEASEIGRITLRDHWALAAVPASGVARVLEATAHQKIKGMKVKVTRMSY